MPALIDVLLYDGTAPGGAAATPAAALSVPAGVPLATKCGRAVAAAPARCARAPMAGRAVVYLLGEVVHEFAYSIAGGGAGPRWAQLNPTADPYVVQLRLAAAEAPYCSVLQLAVQIAAFSDSDRLRVI